MNLTRNRGRTQVLRKFKKFLLHKTYHISILLLQTILPH